MESSSILNKVHKDLQKQEAKGIEKYGTTLDFKFTELEMLKHAYEETLDTCMYLAKLIKIKEDSATVREFRTVQTELFKLIQIKQAELDELKKKLRKLIR